VAERSDTDTDNPAPSKVPGTYKEFVRSFPFLGRAHESIESHHELPVGRQRSPMRAGHFPVSAAALDALGGCGKRTSRLWEV